ncbi:hypothetical protein [Sporolactobacillus pectinivorans]|uniref:hypothetical protein n=1 Tax=Sporolactobacillus pectinivorans TaxID=1591408 RepID=UPI0012FE251E|nr:hypothetical protein [Sporolactobacillus pectinivorans]
MQNIEHRWGQVVRVALRNYQVFGEEETIAYKDKINFSVYMLGQINYLLETKD